MVALHRLTLKSSKNGSMIANHVFKLDHSIVQLSTAVSQSAYTRLLLDPNTSITFSRRCHINLHLAPQLGVTPFEFRQDLWHQKTRVPGLSCGVVCVILRLAVLTQYCRVTDRQTDGRTPDRSFTLAGVDAVRVINGCDVYRLPV